MEMRQRLLRFILDMFGYIYISIEQFVEYPDDSEIMGVGIDGDLHRMNRHQLCRYMDAVLPQSGFFDLQSTTKIRLGCQLLRNFHLMKKKLTEDKVQFSKASRETAGVENDGWI